MIRGRGSFTRISNNVGPQIPVISDNVPDLTARDVHVSGVGAVRSLRLDWPNALFTCMARYQFEL